MFPDALKYYRKNARLSQAALAELLNVSQSTIAMWESGKNTPEYNSLIKLSTIFNISTDSLVGKSSDIAVKTIPVFSDVTIAFRQKDILYYENVFVNPLDYNNYFGFIMQDDSMSPRIMKGDLLIVKDCTNFLSGDVCVIRINRTDITVKKVIKNDHGIILMSLNSIFEPIFYSNDDIKKLHFSIIGKVVELRAKI